VYQHGNSKPSVQSVPSVSRVQVIISELIDTSHTALRHV
jgi:hypothetical protein